VRRSFFVPWVVNTDTYSGERAEPVVFMASLAKFGEWPLTAQTLRGEPLSKLAGWLPPRDSMMNRV
jgi:hypothetical protein